MKQYNVTGMSCAACSARVEKAVGSLSGVDSCSVNLLTNSMNVSGSVSDSEVIEAVVKAGYGASLKGAEDKKTQEKDAFKDTETPKLKRRLVLSLGFLAVLMYVSMGHNMFSLPMPAFFEDNAIANSILQLLLTIAVMIINRKFFISGFRGLINKAPNMDTLVALGSGASFLWSTYVLFCMTAPSAIGNHEVMHALLHDLYFESAAMILALITVGKMLEARSKGKTTNALKSLMDLKPKTATLIIDGKETVVNASEIKKDDVFVVRPGESIPTDGVVIEGTSAVNEAALTGESIPVDKKERDTVSAGTVNQSGFLKCRATAVGEDTTLSQIISMVSDAAATKAPISKIADKVSGIFVPVVLAIALVTGIIWLISGQSIAFALARGISVLVISCPCALGLATPVAIMVSSGKGAKNGILFKTAEAIEKSGKIQVVALDKTGTITKGEPEVTDLLPFGSDEKDLLSFAYCLEKKSEHPLAKAIVKKAEKEQIPLKEVSDFAVTAGKGVSAKADGDALFGGNLKFIESVCSIPDDVKVKADELSREGKTPLYFCKNSSLIGVIFVCDVIKEESTEAISELKNMGIYTVMLTGDNEQVAAAIGKTAGVDEIIAGVLPGEKEKVVRQLQKKGNVAMVGDGINDAVALTRADIGIAIGAGTDVAIDSADIVLMKSTLKDVPALLRLGRSTLRIIHQNLFWAFFYNALCIPLAAGAFIPVFGWTLNPMLGAVAMSLSSFCVVSNALRLNLIDIKSTKHDRKIRKKLNSTNTQTENEGEITIRVEGMMCEHCEKRVKDCLESISGIDIALPDHKTGEVRLTISGEIDMKLVKAEIKKAGYKLKNS